MKCKLRLTDKFMGNFMYNHFSDEHCKFFKPEGRDINLSYLFPLKDSLDKSEYEEFEQLLFQEVDSYAYSSYQNGFKDGVRHILSLSSL